MVFDSSNYAMLKEKSSISTHLFTNISSLRVIASWIMSSAKLSYTGRTAAKICRQHLIYINYSRIYVNRSSWDGSRCIFLIPFCVHCWNVFNTVENRLAVAQWWSTYLSIGRPRVRIPVVLWLPWARSPEGPHYMYIRYVLSVTSLPPQEDVMVSPWF